MLEYKKENFWVSHLKIQRIVVERLPEPLKDINFLYVPDLLKTKYLLNTWKQLYFNQVKWHNSLRNIVYINETTKDQTTLLNYFQSTNFYFTIYKCK